MHQDRWNNGFAISHTITPVETSVLPDEQMDTNLLASILAFGWCATYWSNLHDLSALRSPRLTSPHHQIITFPMMTSNSQLQTAADCIKVEAYLMKQWRELLGRNNPSPPSDLKVTANEKKTDKVARITGDVETAEARNG
ncbi:hypothetical protein BS47DRAFT_1359613 [Hydnum rufescens UP504]|uniref:Uncharacterized protein n=1 Tax=Hydnum rufescens UP504 TaxID=1448309 RepID=A0A9P6B564_9AGAM|nr:hypothetical protein BS47DRAFT_1359613 [Hydnum rufescens UP504]